VTVRPTQQELVAVTSRDSAPAGAGQGRLPGWSRVAPAPLTSHGYPRRHDKGFYL